MTDLTGKTLGRYRILERIGRGGMAEVYKAYQPSLDRYVAIKVLHPFLLEEDGSRERFQREARAVAALRHPNIVQVFDFDNEGDVYFMVMEFIDGPNLKAVLQEQADSGAPACRLDRIDEIITAIGGALGYAHHQGMIHRDVKPHNIMFTGKGQPLLTDFGIAKIVSGSADASASGGAVRHPRLHESRAGPRRARSTRAPTSTRWAWCSTRWSPAACPSTPTRPSRGHQAHQRPAAAAAHVIRPDVPEALERVVLKAMAKDAGRALPDRRGDGPRRAAGGAGLPTRRGPPARQQETTILPSPFPAPPLPNPRRPGAIRNQPSADNPAHREL